MQQFICSVVEHLSDEEIPSTPYTQAMKHVFAAADDEFATPPMMIIVSFPDGTGHSFTRI